MEFTNEQLVITEAGEELLFSDEFEELDHIQQCAMIIMYCATKAKVSICAEQIVTVYDAQEMGYINLEQVLVLRDMVKDNVDECKWVMSPLLNSYN